MTYLETLINLTYLKIAGALWIDWRKAKQTQNDTQKRDYVQKF